MKNGNIESFVTLTIIALLFLMAFPLLKYALFFGLIVFAVVKLAKLCEKIAVWLEQ